MITLSLLVLRLVNRELKKSLRRVKLKLYSPCLLTYFILFFDKTALHKPVPENCKFYVQWTFKSNRIVAHALIVLELSEQPPLVSHS